MKRIFVLCALAAQSYACAAQLHDLVRPEGYQAFAMPGEPNRFNFNFSSNRLELEPVIRPIEFSLTNASICDSSGALQFMANGCWVAGPDGKQMLNGSGVGTGITFTCPQYGRSFQGAVALPIPGSDSKYVLIMKNAANDQLEYNLSINWSEVDMSADNGHGKVVKKNQSIFTDTCHTTQMTACKHANGRDWWIVLPPHDFSDRYVMLLLDPTGLRIHHEQHIGAPETYISPFGYGKSAMQACFSPDGSKYVRGSTWDGTKVYDFDRCTGFLSNEQIVTVYHHELYSGIGACISPNSRFLYLANGSALYQTDLYAQDLEAAKVRIDTIDGTESLNQYLGIFHIMLGAEGKMYITHTNSSYIWHTIHQPNEKGAACLFRQHDLRLPCQNWWGNIECYSDMFYDGIWHGPHFRLGTIDGSACDTLGLDNRPLAGWHWDLIDTAAQNFRFADHSTYGPTAWHWDFGDGSTSQDTSPWHVFPANGTYTVCLTVCNALACDTLCQSVTVSGMVAAPEPALSKTALWLRPNPANDIAYLSGLGAEGAAYVLYDGLGRLAKTGQILDGALSLEGLPAGIYALTVRPMGGPAQTLKLAVQR